MYKNLQIPSIRTTPLAALDSDLQKRTARCHRQDNVQSSAICPHYEYLLLPVKMNLSNTTEQYAYCRGDGKSLAAPQQHRHSNRKKKKQPLNEPGSCVPGGSGSGDVCLYKQKPLQRSKPRRPDTVVRPHSLPLFPGGTPSIVFQSGRKTENTVKKLPTEEGMLPQSNEHISRSGVRSAIHAPPAVNRKKKGGGRRQDRVKRKITRHYRRKHQQQISSVGRSKRFVRTTHKAPL